MSQRIEVREGTPWLVLNQDGGTIEIELTEDTMSMIWPHRKRTPELDTDHEKRRAIETVIDAVCRVGLKDGRDPIDYIRGQFPDLYCGASEGKTG